MAKLTGYSTIRFWMENEIDIDDVEEMPDPDKRPICWVKIAFAWAFYHLKHCSTYEDAIKDILKRGGDTSMNAAIVGGLIGALNVNNEKLED